MATLPTSQLEKQFKRPGDFINQATEAGAEVHTGHGSRVVVKYHGKTIGFSNHGNKEYSRNYRHILIKAFSAAGLLTLLFTVWRFFHA